MVALMRLRREAAFHKRQVAFHREQLRQKATEIAAAERDLATHQPTGVGARFHGLEDDRNP